MRRSVLSIGAGVHPLQVGRLCPRRGASLVSTVVALGLTAACLTLVVHAALQGDRFATSQQHRAEAFAACQGHMETLRAGGYSALPSVGTHVFQVESAFAARAETVIAAGPVSDSRTVTVRVRWPLAEGHPAGQVELSTVMAARGLKP